jgi:hypothetical protein
MWSNLCLQQIIHNRQIIINDNGQCSEITDIVWHNCQAGPASLLKSWPVVANILNQAATGPRPDARRHILLMPSGGHGHMVRLPGPTSQTCDLGLRISADGPNPPSESMIL